MTNPHFAKFADVWKHLPLLEILRIERPRRYWETHAGSALYPLTRSPEREFGVYWFLDHAAANPLASSLYHEVLVGLPQADGYPIEYPGSAMQAMLAFGRQADEFLLCDRDPASIRDLEVGSERAGVKGRTRCMFSDGPTTIWSEFSKLSSADISETLCHLDPFDSFAHEPGSPSSIDLFQRLSLAGARAVYWYAFEEPDERGWLLSQLTEPVQVWCGDMLLPERDESGLLGCGVALTNVSDEAIHRCAEVGSTIEGIYTDARLPSGGAGSVSFASLTS